MSEKLKHEPDTTSIPIMSASAAGLLMLMFCVVGVVALGFPLLVPKNPMPSADAVAQQQQLTPGVQPHQAFQRLQLQAEQRQLLQEFGWHDKSQRLARIPIEQAIKIMANRQLQTNWAAVDATHESTEKSNEPAAQEQP